MKSGTPEVSLYVLVWTKSFLVSLDQHLQIHLADHRYRNRMPCERILQVIPSTCEDAGKVKSEEDRGRERGREKRGFVDGERRGREITSFELT